MIKLPEFVSRFARGAAVFDGAITSLLDEYGEDEPPATIALSEFGRAFAARADELGEAEIREVFSRVESSLRSGDESERNAVATGFLEALASAIDQIPAAERLLDHAGPLALKYIAAWDEFCGVSR